MTGPQFQFGATSDEAANEAQIAAIKLPNQGGIVDSQQFQLPSAQPTTTMSDRPGNNLGES